MDAVVAYWAGEERAFRLGLGEVFDLEEACGDVGIGEIYQRMGQHCYKGRFIFHTLRLGLIGGGMTPVAAKALVTDRMETVPFAQSFDAALTVLLGLMAGVPPADPDAPTGDPSEPHNVGEILAALVKMGIAPTDARKIRYADFLRLLRAMPGEQGKPPSEDEFNEMVELAILHGHMADPGREALEV